MNLLEKNYREQNGRERGNDDNKNDEAHWTPGKIAQLLNIEVDRAEQPEANVLFKLFAGKDMLAFGDHSIKVAPKCK